MDEKKLTQTYGNPKNWDNINLIKKFKEIDNFNEDFGELILKEIQNRGGKAKVESLAEDEEIKQNEANQATKRKKKRTMIFSVIIIAAILIGTFSYIKISKSIAINKKNSRETIFISTSYTFGFKQQNNMNKSLDDMFNNFAVASDMMSLITIRENVFNILSQDYNVKYVQSEEIESNKNKIPNEIVWININCERQENYKLITFNTFGYKSSVPNKSYKIENSKSSYKIDNKISEDLENFKIGEKKPINFDDKSINDILSTIITGKELDFVEKLTEKTVGNSK